MKIQYSLLIIFLSTFGLHGQQLDYTASVNARGIGYSNSESPFWFHSNQRGRTDEITNFSGWMNTSARYQLSNNTFLEAGLGALYQDGYTDKFQLDESYLKFQINWLSVVIGRKQQQEYYRGLSASNKNILWSLNARPMPGIQIGTNRPVYFSGNTGMGFQASFEEYFTDDNRYVEDVRVHHKSFHLLYKASEKFEISAGLQHFVQWGGTSPEFGKLPQSFKEYMNVVLGKEGDDIVGGQEANALGNHLGSYEITLKTKIQNYDLHLIYNHLFEDGSGRRLGNTPDGRYGIYLEDPETNHWINAFIYELYYTKNQSKNTPTTDGVDNYFNNNLYRSGWTYENRILGVPFITLDDDRFRINNNKIVAHHLGFSGIAFEKLPYKLLTSYRKNYGAKGGGNLKNDILSAYLDLSLWQKNVNVNLQLGSDFISNDSPNFGAGVQVSKKLF